MLRHFIGVLLATRRCAEVHSPELCCAILVRQIRLVLAARLSHRRATTAHFDANIQIRDCPARFFARQIPLARLSHRRATAAHFDANIQIRDCPVRFFLRQIRLVLAPRSCRCRATGYDGFSSTWPLPILPRHGEVQISEALFFRAGTTESSDFPTSNPFQSSYGGGLWAPCFVAE